MQEEILNSISWETLEYEHRNHSTDFLWSIGLMTIVSAVLAIILRNYLFSVFIIISGFCLIIFSIRKPEKITCLVDNSKISLGRDEYVWKNIKNFYINKKGNSVKLLINTNENFLPVYAVPLPDYLVEEVRSALLKKIPESEIEESQPVLFMEKLGF